MKLLVVTVVLLAALALAAEARHRRWNRNRHQRIRLNYNRHYNRKGKDSSSSSSSSSSSNEGRKNKLAKTCPGICQLSPLREKLINTVCKDPCEDITCNHQGSCSKGRCTCFSGFEGCDCQNDINECTNGDVPCDGNATCTNTPGSFDCNCNGGFTGDGISCSDIDECTNGDVPCNGNATCTNTPGSFDCTCNDGFSGDGTTCTDIDECTNGDAACDDDATCTNTPGSFDCTCNNGFSGNGTTCSIRECTDSGITVNITQVNDEVIIEQVNNICQNSCISDPMCITYLFTSGSLSNMCFLLSIDVTTVTSLTPDDAVTTGVCNCPNGTTCDERVCTEFSGMNIPIPDEVAAEIFGSVLNTFNLNSVCKARCRVNPLCNSYAFNTVLNTCVLFSIDVTEPSLGLGPDGVNVVEGCE